MPVGALVLATNATAGVVWHPEGARIPIARTLIVGHARRERFPSPPEAPACKSVQEFERQIRIFGERGQRTISLSKVGIVGLGGVGSQMAELLGRLGVGSFVLVDPDRADASNLSRLIGARRSDVLISEATVRRMGRFAPIFDRLRTRKVDLAARNIRRANPKAIVKRIFGNIVDRPCTTELLDCDYLFLAADQMAARLVVNAIVHQYLIPAVQVGARVVADGDTGRIEDVFAVSRPISPDHGCLWCNSLIDPTKLQLEVTDPHQREKQRYGTESEAPSVVTLNALGVGEAVNSFLFYLSGLAHEATDPAYMRFRPLRRAVAFDEPSKLANCTECGKTEISRFARGDGADLPVRG